MNTEITDIHLISLAKYFGAEIELVRLVDAMDNHREFNNNDFMSQKKLLPEDIKAEFGWDDMKLKNSLAGSLKDDLITVINTLWCGIKYEPGCHTLILNKYNKETAEYFKKLVHQLRVESST